MVRIAADSLEYQMTVVDFISDWFDLAHGMRHPIGRYEFVLRLQDRRRH
ncbi:conserved hypothetical protein [Cupriavidus taiwanensis]|uniref:Uncharacterized protein n=1 Tax=Cupriavidus taiwanensis TaxID=164546 RepID=A0A375JBT3_9BURK|nr:conserved hypothetical protein [Cupriavidus taiwanensis]